MRCAGSRRWRRSRHAFTIRHVDRDDDSAKFWLAPVALASNLGFTTVELRRVQRLIVEHEARLLEAWNEYFGASPGRACEGRAVYRRRPGRRSAGRSHHLSAARDRKSV